MPNTVKKIGDYAFYNHIGLTTLTIPSSVSTIGNYAFYNCYNLSSMTIPGFLISIGTKAFYNDTKLTIYYGGDCYDSVFDDFDLVFELKTSKRMIENKLGRKCSVLAFPFPLQAHLLVLLFINFFISTSIYI